MLKRLGGLKANAKIPPLLLPVLPCLSKTNPHCNGYFLPMMSGQKACLYCLNYKKCNCFDAKTPREVIIMDIVVTWRSEQQWEQVEQTINLVNKNYAQEVKF